MAASVLADVMISYAVLAIWTLAAWLATAWVVGRRP
jgi:hypothetical protein